MRLAVVEVEPRRGLITPLEPGAVIGRARGCDIRITDPLVSRRHALVWRSGDEWAIEDLGSHNGVYVNNLRCEGLIRLRAGDELRLGTTTWIVVPLPRVS